MKIIKQKKIEKILQRVVVNYIITVDALKKNGMDVKDYTYANSYLADNVISVAEILDGKKGIEFVKDLVKYYKEKLNEHNIFI